MLYVVLVLVLAAFGLLIAALTTANTLFAWVSVAVSVIAAVLLILDWLKGRRTATEPRHATTKPDSPDPEPLPTERQTPEPAADPEPTEYLAPEPPPPPMDMEPAAEEQGEPAEEPTDASDLLVVAGLSTEVLVVDEHPRYHLTNCTWLTGRGTIPIAVSEARQLGFTPCARCGPDAVLAAKHRATR